MGWDRIGLQGCIHLPQLGRVCRYRGIWGGDGMGWDGARGLHLPAAAQTGLEVWGGSPGWGRLEGGAGTWGDVGGSGKMQQGPGQLGWAWDRSCAATAGGAGGRDPPAEPGWPWALGACSPTGGTGPLTPTAGSWGFGVLLAAPSTPGSEPPPGGSPGSCLQPAGGAGGCLFPSLPRGLRRCCLPLPEPEAGQGGRALSWGGWGAAGRTFSL